jgi:hypothetical protein
LLVGVLNLEVVKVGSIDLYLNGFDLVQVFTSSHLEGIGYGAQSFREQGMISRIKQGCIMHLLLGTIVSCYTFGAEMVKRGEDEQSANAMQCESRRETVDPCVLRD